MKKGLILVVLSIALITHLSCTETLDNDAVVLDESIYDTAQKVFPDTVCIFSDTVLSSHALMIDGRYAVLSMDDRTSYFLKVYDTETMMPVTDYLHYGNGPYEVLGASVEITDGRMVVHDRINSVVYQMPCTDVPVGGNLIDRKYAFMSNEVLPYGDGFVALNPYWFEDERLGISNGEPRLFFSDGMEICYDDTKLRSNTAMDADLLCSSPNGRIAYVDRYCPLVEIYDDTLGLVRKVFGPGTEMPLYRQNGDINIVWEELPLTTWQSACADDDYIYLLWNGIKDDQKVERPQTYMYEADGEEKDLLLVVLNWEEALVKAFRPQGLTSYSVLSVGDGDGVVYASSVDSDMTHLSILNYRIF